MEAADGFHTSDRPIKSSRVSRSVFWIRIDVRNAGEAPGTWVISLDRVLLDPAAIYLVTGERTEPLLENTPQSFKSSYRKFQTLAGRFHLQPGETASLYIRYRGANWSGLQPLLFEESDFIASMKRKNVAFLLLTGALVALILVGSIAFVYLGRQIFLLYAVAQIAFYTFYAHMSGYTTIYLWPDNPELGRVVAPIATLVFVVAMAQFARYFFSTRRDSPILDRWLSAIIVAGLVCILLIPLDYLIPAFPRDIPIVIGAIVTIVCWLLLPYLAVRTTWKSDTDAWPLAVAWVFTSIVLLGIQMLWVGLSGTLPLGKGLYGVTVAWEAVFQALAITLRVRRLGAEKLEAQQRLGESLALQLTASRRARRLAEDREWALQDLAEKGRLLLAAGHDTRQMLSALRNYTTGFRRGVLKNESGVIDEGRLLAASLAIDEITDSLNAVLTTAVEGSRSGGIADTAVALDTTDAAGILDPLVMLYGHGSDDGTVTFHVHASPIPVTTDTVLVLRILSNFLSNAFKFTDRGRILLAARRYGSGVRFQVRDSGRGMSPETLARVLDRDNPGHRVDEQEEGLGAGLRIARELAARLDGEIRARSSPGRGSLFELLLPAYPGSASGRSADLSFLLLDQDAENIRQITTQAARLNLEITICHDVPALKQELSRKTAQRPSLSACLIDQKFMDDEQQIQAIDQLVSRNDHLRPVVLTYDRSGDARARLSHRAELILYRPVSARALLGAAGILLRPR